MANEHMNPNYPNRRGCFIDGYTHRNEATKKCERFIVTDYPTYTANKGIYVEGANLPIPAGKPFTKEFKTYEEAKAYAASENYLVCQVPREIDPYRKNKKPEEETFDDEWDY